MPEVELDLARQLLLADEVEAAFDGPSTAQARPSHRWRTVVAWVVGGIVVAELIVAFVVRVL